jgi:pimeloyl-ACP methyl ester carboxylesterase
MKRIMLLCPFSLTLCAGAVAQTPYPRVLLLHGWSGSKEAWYVDGNNHSGGEMRKALLGAGYAVMALDASTHGERNAEIDYQHVNPFNDPNAPLRQNYFMPEALEFVKQHLTASDHR